MRRSSAPSRAAAFDALDRLIDVDITDHNAVPGQVAGRVGIKYWVTMMHGDGRRFRRPTPDGRTGRQTGVVTEHLLPSRRAAGPSSQLGRPEVLRGGGVTTGTHLRVSPCDLGPPSRIHEPIDEPMAPAGMKAAPAAWGGAGL
jgi:hypothetical protein